MWEKKLDSERPTLRRHRRRDAAAGLGLFPIPTYAFGHLTPGTLVRVQVSPRRNQPLSLEPRQEGQARLPGKAGRAGG